MASTSQPPLRFTSHKNFVYRLVFATLTGRTIQISQIRPSSPTNPGLAPHEISFLRLLESITNGSQMEISYTGTILVYKPGLITGSSPGVATSSGGVIRHELPAGCNRGVSYYLLPLCLLAPFSKAPIKVLFTGPGVITSSTPTGDMSVDSVRTAILPLYNQFGIFNNIELRILRRSNPGPNGRGGGGEVQLVFGHQLRLPKTLHLMNAGRIKKVRGVAYSVGVSASNNARMIETARGVLNPLVPDTYVFSDVSSAPLVPAPEKSNPSAKKKIGLGFGLSLVAESSTGCLFSADVASPPAGGEAPEDIGKRCAYQLLEAVSKGGCVAPAAVPTMLGLMTMGSEDVGRIQVGREVIAEESTIQLARDLTKFGAPGWGLRDASGENENGDVIISVVGRGIGNVGHGLFDPDRALSSVRRHPGLDAFACLNAARSFPKRKSQFCICSFPAGVCMPVFGLVSLAILTAFPSPFFLFLSLPFCPSLFPLSLTLFLHLQPSLLLLTCLTAISLQVFLALVSSCLCFERILKMLLGLAKNTLPTTQASSKREMLCAFHPSFFSSPSLATIGPSSSPICPPVLTPGAAAMPSWMKIVRTSG
ncbi:probable RNA 3'-terminal phosphate cyclase-like protein [Aspergillus awamori]|uniref:Probable RNA 3'-terminal phosphate cyclase-like protein n=1 Tax=Aspergillus awamori TaxID=105351 RepID=A0A401L0J9_ASPAW|nr:probable RNA 3'-terminal phosphate cyclase-like protein [Aspergillus awamori]